MLVGFLAALNGFFDPIGQLSQLYTTYQSGMAALDKIFELLDEQPDLVEPADPVALPQPLHGEITFDDVTFAYGEKPALRRRVAAWCRRARRWRWSARRAPGKSTFAKLVARFYDPTAGRVLIDGIDLRTVRSRSLREQMGIVPQEGFLFSGTVGDNIAFGNPSATDADARGRVPRRRRLGLHRAPARRGSTRRSASAACSSPPGSASSWRSRARWSRTRAS